MLYLKQIPSYETSNTNITFQVQIILNQTTLTPISELKIKRYFFYSQRGIERVKRRKKEPKRTKHNEQKHIYIHTGPLYLIYRSDLNLFFFSPFSLSLHTHSIKIRFLSSFFFFTFLTSTHYVYSH